MAAGERRQALLGRLAGLGWSFEFGEVTATRSLAILLEVPQLSRALLRHLAESTGVDLDAVASFVPEVSHSGIGRTDLEGFDDQGRPLVLVEAKFGAWLGRDQVQAYWSYLAGKLEPGVQGALVLLVPAHRGPEAKSILRAVAADQPGGATAPDALVATYVLSWDGLLAVLDEAAEELAGPERDNLVGDLRQLRGLCETMVAVDIGPLGHVANGHEWKGREDELRRLVDQATRKCVVSGLGPFGMEWDTHYYRRYIPGGSDIPACACSIGVGGLTDYGTPFWLRYHKDTPGFATVNPRILASRFADQVRRNGGHLWLPLHVSADRSGAVLVEELVRGIEAIRAVAAGAEAPPAGAS